MRRTHHTHPALSNNLKTVEVYEFSCQRCVARGITRSWYRSDRAIPLADGTLVCAWCATEAERRNRWCLRCGAVKDESEFPPGRLSCLACNAPKPRPQHTCEHCGSGFTPSRSDARFCSTRCRVAAHRARTNPEIPT